MTPLPGTDRRIPQDSPAGVWPVTQDALPGLSVEDFAVRAITWHARKARTATCVPFGAIGGSDAVNRFLNHSGQ
jgi:hypothetical protein